MHALPQDNGVMYAVKCDIKLVKEAITSLVTSDISYTDHVAVASNNGPENVVITGSKSAVQKVLLTLKNKCKAQQQLNVSYAFHSPLMNPMVKDFHSELQHIKTTPCKIPLASTVSG